MTQPAQNEKKESMLLNILLNIVIPTIVLIKFSGEEWLGVRNGIIVALSFPIAYGLYDFTRAKKVNIFSCIGIVSIILTGGISLLKMPPEYIAIKEAAIPALIGIFALASVYTKYPLLKALLFNDKVVQIEKVEDALEKSNNKKAFDSSFRTASLIFSCSFFLSAFLNYGLARYLVVSPPGTQEFNAELGKMTALSFPVITIPSMIVMLAALFFLYRRITQLTHLTMEEILIDQNADKKKA